MEDIKKVVTKLIQDFIEEERGNRVTFNNMRSLHINITDALDGKITIKKSDDKPEKE